MKLNDALTQPAIYLSAKSPTQKSGRQITIALVYKFMDDMDKEAVELEENLAFLPAIMNATHGAKYSTLALAVMKCWGYMEKRL